MGYPIQVQEAVIKKVLLGNKRQQYQEGCIIGTSIAKFLMSKNGPPIIRRSL